MHGSVGEAKGRGQAHPDHEPHAHTRDARDGQVHLHLHSVQLAQHEDGVDKHEHVAAGKLDRVKEDGIRADVAVAARGVRVHAHAGEGGVQGDFNKGLLPIKSHLRNYDYFKCFQMKIYIYCFIISFV